MAIFKVTRFDLETKGVTLGTGERHLIAILSGRGKRLLVEDEHFHTDSAMFLPSAPGASGGGVAEPRAFANDAFWDAVRKNNSGYVETAKEGEFIPPPGQGEGGAGAQGANGLDLILAALKFLAAHADHALVIAGHTDRAGSEAHNEELSGARAACVAAVLEGERAQYVDAVKVHHKPESDGSMLAFAADARGFPCEPADPVRPAPGEIEAFQKAYNESFGKSIAVDGVAGGETRGAYFDLLDAELARRAGGDAALTSLRGKVSFVDEARKTLACGERFPIDRPDQDGVASQINRRVELLFFPPDPRPDLTGGDAPDRVYHKGTFSFDQVDADTLEAAGGDEVGVLLADAPPPPDGVGEMKGALQTKMVKLQDAPDPQDQYAFLQPFDAGFPEFGSQAVGDFPVRSGDTVLV